MAGITVSGNKKLKTLKAEFQKEFEYLTLGFYSLSDWNKATNSVGFIQELNGDQRLSEVRLKKPTAGEKEISLHGRTLVKNLEKNFKEIYGICIQVCISKYGKGYYTNGKYDDMSLTQLNKYCAENGYDINPK